MTSNRWRGDVLLADRLWPRRSAAGPGHARPRQRQTHAQSRKSAAFQQTALPTAQSRRDNVTITTSHPSNSLPQELDAL
jgi:hypothetical protein